MFGGVHTIQLLSIMTSRSLPMIAPLSTSNRFAVLGEDEERMGRGGGAAAAADRLPPTAPARAVSHEAPLPKRGAEGGSYSERFRQRQAAAAPLRGAPAAPPPPDVGSVTEFPALGKAAPANTSLVSLFGGNRPHATPPHTYSSWAAKAAALAELDAREEEARSIARAKAEAAAAAVVPIACFQTAPTYRGPSVEDYEEEDRIRGMADEESYTPLYGRYDHEEGYGEGYKKEDGDEEDGEGGYGEEEDRW